MGSSLLVIFTTLLFIEVFFSLAVYVLLLPAIDVLLLLGILLLLTLVLGGRAIAAVLCLLLLVVHLVVLCAPLLGLQLLGRGGLGGYVVLDLGVRHGVGGVELLVGGEG